MTGKEPPTKIVDTNVAVVANGGAAAGPDCVRRCTAALRALTESGRIAVDDGWRIIKEYRSNLSESGQPGPGDMFLKWLLTNLRNSKRCSLVRITPTGGDGENYSEFPADPTLKTFDPSDRKFVAVAMALDGRAMILEAVDSQWWGFREALCNAGVDVQFLCEEEIARTHREQRRRS